MDLGTIANVATAAAVITGLVFGLAEIVRARREREERAAFEMVHAMLTPEWLRSVLVVHMLPDGMTGPDLEADLRKLEAAQSVSLTTITLAPCVPAAKRRMRSAIFLGTIVITRPNTCHRAGGTRSPPLASSAPRRAQMRR